MEIKKVLVRKDGCKMVIIPRESNMNAGDLIMIIKMNEKEVENYVRRK